MRDENEEAGSTTEEQFSVCREDKARLALFADLGALNSVHYTVITESCARTGTVTVGAAGRQGAAAVAAGLLQRPRLGVLQNRKEQSVYDPGEQPRLLLLFLF